MPPAVNPQPTRIILSGQGYRPLQLRLEESCFRTLIETISNAIGEGGAQAIMHHVIVKKGVPRNELENYPELFWQGVTEILGIGAEIIAETFARKLGLTGSDFSPMAMMRHARTLELSRLLSELNEPNHILILFNDPKFRDDLLSRFFSPNPDIPQYIAAHKPPQLKNLQYNLISDLIRLPPEKALMRHRQWLGKSRKYRSMRRGPPTRSAHEDVTIFFRHGIRGPSLEFEYAMGRNIPTNEITVCCYDHRYVEEKFTGRQPWDLINSHGLVFVEDEMRVYQAPK
jgi:hypothetical protein